MPNLNLFHCNIGSVQQAPAVLYCRGKCVNCTGCIIKPFIMNGISLYDYICLAHIVYGIIYKLYISFLLRDNFIHKILMTIKPVTPSANTSGSGGIRERYALSVERARLLHSHQDKIPCLLSICLRASSLKPF